MDDNAARRRLGIYRLSYQLIDRAAEPVDGFAQPLTNIAFDVLPRDARAVQIAYAQGSNAGYGGETVFAYQVTSIVRDGEAREDLLDATTLPAGKYLLRIVAEDFFGNRTTRDFGLKISDRQRTSNNKRLTTRELRACLSSFRGRGARLAKRETQSVELVDNGRTG